MDNLLAENLAAGALMVATEQLGRGEAGGNNAGPDVIRYLAPAHPPANWCAAFVGWCYAEAARRLAMRRLPFERSLGAKQLGRRVAACGKRFTWWGLAAPGDLIVWHRGTLSWTGHVGLVERIEGDVVHTIEGNTGRFPSKVRRLAHDVAHERLAFFATLRRG